MPRAVAQELIKYNQNKNAQHLTEEEANNIQQYTSYDTIKYTGTYVATDCCPTGSRTKYKLALIYLGQEYIPFREIEEMLLILRRF